MTQHIAFFSGDITRSGGTENVSIMIANALADADDYDICFISLFEEADQPFFDIDPRIGRYTVYPVPTHGIQHYFNTVNRLKRLVVQHDIDALVDIDGILDMYSLPIKRFTGVKVVSWEHFNYNQNPGVPYRKLTRRWAARRADTIVTLTQADKKLYEEHLQLRCPVVTIPNPIRMPEPEPVYDIESRTIISSGRLTYQKGFDLLVDVAAQVLPSHPDWQWWILGDGEDQLMLEQKIAEADIGNQLILKGRVGDMDEYYRNAAMLVMTSRFEGLPMVLLEAKSYHLPIVSFDCETGPAEVVQDGMNGDLIPPEQVDQMAQRVNRLIDEPERRNRYSRHAMDVASVFDLGNILKQWKALLRVRNDII